MAISAFVAAWFIHLIAAASPGPAILMAARVGVTDGIKTGACLAVGLGLGALFWAISALFGMAILFQTLPTFMLVLKIMGGLFLIWISLQTWRHATDPLDHTPTTTQGLTPLQALKLGVMTQLANPKPAVFFGAVFVGTLPPDASMASLIALMGVIFLNEFLCNIGVARLFSFAPIRHVY
ncbi:MAG: LysE family translocator, partial [Pseudomonadota bacterium]